MDKEAEYLFIIWKNKYKLMRMKSVLIAILCIFIPFAIEAKKETPFKYDITCAGTGGEGTYLVKVTVYTVKRDQATNDLLRKAGVHGVIFRGFTGTDGCISQKALAKSPTVEEEKADFFTAFFKKNGPYMTYSSLVKGSIQTAKSNKEYQTSAVISVSKDLLRQDLEKAGVIRSLSSAF